MANDELYTPKFIFEALKIDFDLDVCAPESGPLHTPAYKWYSVKDDGLVQPWFGRVWLNPPYSNAAPWIDKWLDHKDGFALVQISKSFWFHRLWNSTAKVIYPSPHIKFINEDGKGVSIYMPISLWAIGERNIDLLKMSGLGHVR